MGILFVSDAFEKLFLTSLYLLWTLATSFCAISFHLFSSKNVTSTADITILIV